MAHKRVRSNRARRIVNFRRFDVASVVLLGEGGRREELAFHNGREHEIPRVHLSKSDERELGNGYTRAQYPPSWRIFMKLRGRWMRNRSRKLCDPLCSVHLERVKRSSRETLFRHVSNDLPRLRGIVSARTYHPFRFQDFPLLLHTIEKNAILPISFSPVDSITRGGARKTNSLYKIESCRNSFSSVCNFPKFDDGNFHRWF